MFVPDLVTRVKVIVPPWAWPAASLPFAGSALQFQSVVWSQDRTSKPRGTETTTSWLYTLDGSPLASPPPGFSPSCMACMALACPPCSSTGTEKVISVSESFGTDGSSAVTCAQAGTAHPASIAVPSSTVTFRFIALSFRGEWFVVGQVTLRTG